MKILQRMSALVAVGVLTLASSLAQAQVTASFNDASGFYMGSATPSAALKFDSDYDLTSFDLQIDYLPSLMALTSVKYTIVPGNVDFVGTLAAMPGFTQDASSDVAGGFYSFSAFSGDASFVHIDAGSTLLIQAQFKLGSSFSDGTAPVYFSGSLASTAADSGAPLDVFSTADNPARISLVAAPVPEPETWVMMLVGLGLVVTRGLRSRQRPQHG